MTRPALACSVSYACNPGWRGRGLSYVAVDLTYKNQKVAFDSSASSCTVNLEAFAFDLSAHKYFKYVRAVPGAIAVIKPRPSAPNPEHRVDDVLVRKFFDLFHTVVSMFLPSAFVAGLLADDSLFKA